MKTKKKNEQWEHKHQGELAMKEVLFQLDQMLVNQSAQVKKMEGKDLIKRTVWFIRLWHRPSNI